MSDIYYTDKESGIGVGVNTSAIESEEQAKAIEDFMKALMGIPTYEEMCEWVDGYEDFSNVLNCLKELDADIKKYCMEIKKYKLHTQSARLECNFKEIFIKKERDIANLQDVIKVVIK